MASRKYKNTLNQPLPISLNSKDMSVKAKSVFDVEESDWNSSGILSAVKKGHIVLIEETHIVKHVEEKEEEPSPEVFLEIEPERIKGLVESLGEFASTNIFDLSKDETIEQVEHAEVGSTVGVELDGCDEHVDLNADCLLTEEPKSVELKEEDDQPEEEENRSSGRKKIKRRKREK